MTKLFVVSVINTAFVVLLTNALIKSIAVLVCVRVRGVERWRSSTGVRGASQPLLEGGTFSDFTAGWYATVATSILLTMMINVVVPHLGLFISVRGRCCVDRCVGLCERARAKCQIGTRMVSRCWDRQCGCDRTISRQVRRSNLRAQSFVCVCATVVRRRRRRISWRSTPAASS